MPCFPLPIRGKSFYYFLAYFSSVPSCSLQCWIEIMSFIILSLKSSVNAKKLLDLNLDLLQGNVSFHNQKWFHEATLEEVVMGFEYSQWLDLTLQLVWILPCDRHGALPGCSLPWPSAPGDPMSSPNLSWLHLTCHVPSSIPVASAASQHRNDSVFQIRKKAAQSISSLCSLNTRNSFPSQSFNITRLLINNTYKRCFIFG